MSEDKVDRVNKIPSGCPSPARLEKIDSSSSRQSGSPLHWDVESWNSPGRIRRSSWDDDSDDDLSSKPQISGSKPSRIYSSESNALRGSIRPSSWDDDSDDDLSSKPQISGSKPSRIYSSESNEFKGSISSEINELKKQFFQSLEKENSNSADSRRIENLKEKLEMKFKCDRRQSPARVRRRSRSSSSSSPVQEIQNSPETKDKGTGPDSELDDSDTTSPRALGMDSRYYLNNFFSELRSRRISMLDSAPMTEKSGKDGALICDNMKLEMLNELNASDLNDDGGYFCKTSRKLSQILEVEENRKDLGKSSEDSLEKVELFTGNLRKPEVGDSSCRIQTAGRNRAEEAIQSGGDGRQRSRESYKSMSFEEFGNVQKVGRTSRGSLSERSGQIFQPKIDDDFIHLCAKTGKTQLGSPKQTEVQDVEKSFQFVCFAGPLGANKNFSVEASPGKDDVGKNSNRSNHLTKTEMSRSPTPRKSTDRSEKSHTNRTKSGQSRKSSNPQSPTFALNIGGDSARSLRVDEVNTPHFQSKSRERKEASGSKRSSSEECSSIRNSSKGTFRSDDTCEFKTDRNLYITLESPSVKSVQSSRSFSERGMTRNDSRSAPNTQRSQRTGKGTNRATNEEHTPTGQNLTIETPRNFPVGRDRSPEGANVASCRFESSRKTPKSPRIEEGSRSSRVSDPRTPRNQKIPELGLPVEIPESQKASCRTPKATELDDGIRDTSQPQNNSRGASGHSFGSGNRSGRSRKSTPLSRSTNPKTSTNNSVRSNGSLENHERKPPVSVPEEFQSGDDALSNRTSISSSARRSSSREIDLPIQQPSCRSENSAARKSFTPRPSNSFERRPFGSGKSPITSVDSRDKTPSGSLGNISPTKSRPASWTSAESKFTDVPPDVEKLDLDVRSGRTTNRSYLSEEYEEKEEHRSTPASRSEAETDRQSTKPLSIINEVTFEDFESNAVVIKNEDQNPWEKSRPPSRRSRKRMTPKSVRTPSKSSAEDLGAISPPSHPFGGEMWTELIQTFEGSQKSSLFSEKNFPGFPPLKEEDSVGLSVHPSTTETAEKLYDDEINLEDSFEFSRKVQTPKSESKQISERASSNRQREEDFSFSLVYKDSLMDKMKSEDRSLRSPQNMYYVDVDKGGPFGIGEFGDVTWWSGGNSDLQDLDRPKDHGDGMHALQNPEVLVLKPEKREKEVKNQRQLWTELREDFRESRIFPNDQFPSESVTECNRFIPVGLKTSKSDNCINKTVKEGSECQNSEICDFLSENNKRQNIKERNTNSRKMVDRFGSGSVDSETGELDCERTPRLTRSMSDLVIQHPLERYKINELSGSHDSSGAALFEKADSGNGMKNPVGSGTFLARKKEEEIEVKSNNWLHRKTLEKKKSEKREKRAKIKIKGSSLSREPYVGYLASANGQQSLLKGFRRNTRLDQLLILQQTVPENLIPAVGICEGKTGCRSGEDEDDCTFLFTSESVGEGHPDKMCDQISDAILDAHLQQDPDAKVACETLTKTGMILVSGEITSRAVVDYQKVVRETVRHIGYDDSSKGFDCGTCAVLLMVDEQSSDIAAGVHLNKSDEEIGAGDQGLMFGYATDETDECMPLTIVLAHRLNQKIAELRRSAEFWWARPDSKTQVTCEYSLEGGACTPRRVHTVVVSLQHSEKISLEDLRSQVLLRVIKDVIPERYIDSQTVFHINPCGMFLIGGPKGDAGLTGRKTVVDTYGGWGAHGGGSFSGKDFTKVDRSAAYACRWVAKSLVKAGLCRRCLIQVSYAIGVPEPLSVSLFDYGTSKLSRKTLLEIVRKNFDLRPGKIATSLNLKTPIYQKTSAYGHFGRCCFPWEQPKALTR